MSDLTNLLERLYDRCQRGDPGAFDLLFEACIGRVYRLAAAVLRDEEDAEDAVQETLLRVFRQFKSYRREASFETWLTAITVNVCRDHLRRQKLRRTISLEWLRERADPDKPGLAEAVDQCLQGHVLWKLVERMDEKYRLPLLLVYQENLPVAEVARALNLPVRTVYARLQHAYDELSTHLEGRPFPGIAERMVNDVQ